MSAIVRLQKYTHFVNRGFWQAVNLLKQKFEVGIGTQKNDKTTVQKVCLKLFVNNYQKIAYMQIKYLRSYKYLKGKELNRLTSDYNNNNKNSTGATNKGSGTWIAVSSVLLFKYKSLGTFHPFKSLIIATSASPM